DRPCGSAAAGPVAAGHTRAWIRDRAIGRRSGTRCSDGAGRRRARRRAREGLAERTCRGRAHMSDEQSFEDLQRELEEIVTRLERGDVPVDDAIALFRRGEELYKACVERLHAAELRIEELAPRDPVT